VVTIVTVAVRAQEATRIESKEKATRIANYIGHMFVQNDRPQAYLVEIEAPNVVVGSHFHRTDEFQVVLSNGFSLGGRSMEAVAVHYAESFKPYGPLVGNERGLSFFVLRAYSENGEFVMPEARAALQEALVTLCLAKRRSSTVSSGLRETEAASIEVTSLVPILSGAHGLAAFAVRMLSGEALEGPDPALGGGQFHVIINGSWERCEKLLGPRSVLWVGPEEPALRLRAGPGGLEAIIVQFSRETKKVPAGVAAPRSYEDALLGRAT